MHALCISGEENTVEGQISPETALHFLISRPILASSKGEVCTAVKMINHDWRHMYPRLEELLNLQILPSHVMGSDSIHLKKIATPKCLFFWWYWLTYFRLPGEVQAVPVQMSWDHPRWAFRPVWSCSLGPAWQRAELNTLHSPFSSLCVPGCASELKRSLPKNNPRILLFRERCDNMDVIQGT